MPSAPRALAGLERQRLEVDPERVELGAEGLSELVRRDLPDMDRALPPEISSI